MTSADPSSDLPGGAPGQACREAAADAAVRRECEQALAAAAHDLQEPLRALSAWCDLLREHLGARLDRQGAQYLDQALACAARGRGLVRDLLDLARAGRGAAPLEPVSLELALAEALGNVAASLEVSRAEVDVASLPIVRARRSEVVRVLQNVIANALAARRGPGPRLRIRADVRESDGGSLVELRVEDDGVGLDAADTERVFEPFARLAPEAREGSGLGLTLCRRLMESHGGGIALRPREDGGAVCVLRWNAAQAVEV